MQGYDGNRQKAYDQTYGDMLTYRAGRRGKYVFFTGIIRTARNIILPVTLEERLVNAVRNGNVEAMHAQLSRGIPGERADYGDISPTMMRISW